MKHLSVYTRIAFSLACITLSVLLIARTVGFFKDERTAVLRGRGRLVESMAINLSLLARDGDVAGMKTNLQAILRRNPDIRSIAVRRTDESFVLQVGDHQRYWTPPAGGRSNDAHMVVDILKGSEEWGAVEVSFDPLWDRGFMGFVKHPLVLMLLFVTSLGMLCYYVFLRRILKQLNPSKVIPPRVRSAFDTMAEGLLVLDEKGRIVLANEAFAATVGREADVLIGKAVGDLPWRLNEKSDGLSAAPWSRTLEAGEPTIGVLVELAVESGEMRTFLANCTPIKDADGTIRGALTSFDDITLLEEKKTELEHMLQNLRKSSDEIRKQNQELEQLATRDSLTGCYNRRSFFERFDTHWKTADRHGHPLSCVMVDVDHFKRVNDRHGHMVGDQVLQQVAGILKETARDSDVVARYGGEEFSVLMPYTTIEDAAAAAERFRQKIESTRFGAVNVTASLGVSTVGMGAHNPQGLLDQADQCLYIAKSIGRNEVVRWDEMPVVEVNKNDDEPRDDDESQLAIPFHAVTALISALSYRDFPTADHCRRVADLSAAAAEGLMPPSSVYVLETAALLHDIGKIGVPDSILLKADSLTEEEWTVMRRQEQIGVEIIRASFASDALTDIVAHHQTRFEGDPFHPDAPAGESIPLGARILQIADAYDSMVTNQVYRQGRSQTEAFEELRRCAGTQFDPQLVERFISVVRVRRFNTSPELESVSKAAALCIGLQVEGLSAALEEQNLPLLHTLATRMHGVAARQGVFSVAEQAQTLESLIAGEAEIVEILDAAAELIEQCRSTQRTYVRSAATV